jgi:hypothetical protein
MVLDRVREQAAARDDADLLPSGVFGLLACTTIRVSVQPIKQKAGVVLVNEKLRDESAI